MLMTEVTELTCAEVRETLPAYARRNEPSLAVRRHLSRCPHCSTEMARYRTLMSSLKGLEARTPEPPEGLVEVLIRIPSEARRIDVVRVHVARNRRVYAGGAAVALAGAAGAALWQVRKHRAAAA
jgi:anti-sigma factor RsiW